jgi:hypothetical protein
LSAGTRPELDEIESSIMRERGAISPLYQALLNSGPIASGWEKVPDRGPQADERAACAARAHHLADCRAESRAVRVR